MMDGYLRRPFHISSRLLGNPGGCIPPPFFLIHTQDPEEGTDMEHDTA